MAGAVGLCGVCVDHDDDDAAVDARPLVKQRPLAAGGKRLLPNQPPKKTKRVREIQPVSQPVSQPASQPVSQTQLSPDVVASSALHSTPHTQTHTLLYPTPHPSRWQGKGGGGESEENDQRLVPVFGGC